MYFEDEEKDPRRKALEKLKNMMSEHAVEKMRGMKSMKDPNAMETEHEDPEEGQEEADGFEGGKKPGMDMKMGMSMDDDDGDEMSDDHKRMITELYNKHCR